MKRYKSEEGRRLIHESYDRLLNGWNVPYKEVDVSTQYGITHIITAGNPENPPLLLFHGTGDHSALMWIYNARELSASYYVIAVDHIGGSGKSEPNANYDRAFNQVKWLDEIFEVMKLESVYIAGVSYGAYLAYHYAIARPEKGSENRMHGRQNSWQPTRSDEKNDEGISAGSHVSIGTKCPQIASKAVWCKRRRF